MWRPNCLPIFLTLLCVFLAQRSSSAQQRDIDFNRDIRPILSNNCFFCHGPDEKERMGGDDGLRLDVPEGAYADIGGRHAIVPGKPDESELLRRVITEDAGEQMPPPGKGKRLTPAEVETLREWIAQGAKYARHWAYEAPRPQPLPEVKQKDWPRNAIDRFILARLEREGLSPSPEADRALLARRVALDLTGLPPSWEDVQNFLNDKRPDAYDRYVDSLLASPAYGEHWGRLWLDLARYADSAGYADDPERTIWAYRDYVIRALNENLPFDQFTIEQLAGDLLPNATEEQRLATAMHRNTMTNSEGGTNDEEFRNVAVVDRVNTTFAVWMGTSMACAQCHTHKYDPISQEEYFQVFAIFNNTEDADRPNEEPVMEYFTELQRLQRREIESKLEAIERRFASPSPEVLAAAQAWVDRCSQPIAFKPLVPEAAQIGGRAVDLSDKPLDLPPSEQRKRLTIRFLPETSNPTALRLLPTGDLTIHAASVSAVSRTASPARGRYLRVELPGKSRILSLAEVKVLSGGKNIALQGTASQSSTDYGGDARRAIDGNDNGDYAANSTTHTQQSDNPWWEVDLKSERDIEAVEIFNRGDGVEDRLAGAIVLLLDEQRKPVARRELVAAPKRSVLLPLEPSRPIELAAAFVGEMNQLASAADLLSSDAQKLPAVGKAPILFLPFEAIALKEGEALELTLQYSTGSVASIAFEFSADVHATEIAETPDGIATILLKPAAQRTADEFKAPVAYYVEHLAPQLAAERKEREALQAQLAAIKPTTAPIMRELPPGQRRQTHIQYRGNFEDLGPVVQEGAPLSLHPNAKTQPRTRLELAHWIVSETNPLTARVTVNRLWEQIFGLGLVRTSEEFGSQGELPSHPELLDHLAIEFVRNGWDMKQLLRELVTSAAYRQSSRVTPELAQLDPDNRLLARGPRFRLSAEMVRDQSLAVSGLLSRKMLGPSVKPPQPASGLSAAFGAGLDWKPSAGEDKFRRGLYTSWRRSAPYPSMTTFDAPNREVCTIRRNRTNTPLQALVTLNDPVYVEAALGLARRTLAAAAEPQARAKAMLQTALLREIAPAEAERLAALYEETKANFASRPGQAAELLKSVGASVESEEAQLELASWTVVANVVLNLDEFLMKR